MGKFSYIVLRRLKGPILEIPVNLAGSSMQGPEDGMLLEEYLGNVPGNAGGLQNYIQLF